MYLLLLQTIFTVILPIFTSPISAPGETTKPPSSTHGYPETTTRATINFTSAITTTIPRNTRFRKLPPLPKLKINSTFRYPARENFKSLPCKSSSHVRLNFTIFPIYLESVDVRLASCKLHFYVVKEWYDKRFKCDSPDNGMKGGVMKSVDSMWTPDFEPYNGIITKSIRPGKRVMVFPDGNIRQVQSYTLVSPARRSSGFFQPICEIRFASWISKQLKLNGKAESIVDMSRFTESSQWALDKAITKVSYPSGYPEVRAALIFSLRQQSQPMK